MIKPAQDTPLSPFNLVQALVMVQVTVETTGTMLLGSEIGAALTAAIIQAHGGCVAAASTGLDQGASEDGTQSSVAPIWFMYDGDAVYFTTTPESHKAKRIAHGSLDEVVEERSGDAKAAQREEVEREVDRCVVLRQRLAVRRREQWIGNRRLGRLGRCRGFLRRGRRGRRLRRGRGGWRTGRQDGDARR